MLVVLIKDISRWHWSSRFDSF